MTTLRELTQNAASNCGCAATATPAPLATGTAQSASRQWGCYGDLLECVWLAVDRADAHLDPASADLLDQLGNRVCDIWTEQDCGIWELDRRPHNTFSKAGVACSFWLIDALVSNDHVSQARKLWQDLTGYASDLGLFAEEIDPATGAFLGNLPQGLSHLALLNAAALLNAPS